MKMNNIPKRKFSKLEEAYIYASWFAICALGIYGLIVLNNLINQLTFPL